MLLKATLTNTSNLRRSKHTVVLFFIYTIFFPTLSAQNLPSLKISQNGNFILTQDDKPFFWLGDTAWELIHRLNKEEIRHYLKDRADKGFTVIQTVILAELDGLNTPNAYGHLPLIDQDPTQLNEEYFDLVDFVIHTADSLGLYIGLLPTWGDKFNKKWGLGPIIFNSENSAGYTRLLANRYSEEKNIIWILGGDRIPEESQHFDIINGMAKGLETVKGKQLISYHPSGSRIASNFFDQDWLDLDMFQSGHDRSGKDYEFVLQSKKNSKKRPVINGEPRYENIPDRFWEKKDYVWLNDADARIAAYWSILSGAAGHTYGCNDVWQMYSADKVPEISARSGWKEALHLPGARHMKHMKAIFESLPWQEMHFDSTIIVNENPHDEFHMIASVGDNGEFALIYTPTGQTIDVEMMKLKSEKLVAYWYNPRSGVLKEIGAFSNKSNQSFTPWSNGWGSDFLLVIVDQNIKLSE